MATYREMQDRINLDYLNRTDLANETRRAILRAIKHYEKQRFWFNMTSTALAIGTASSTVAIPADFLILDYVTVTDNLVQKLVTIRSYDRIAYKLTDASSSGVVSEVAYWRDALQFAPKPASATTLTVNYTQSLAVLSADSDTNGWTSAAEDLIVHHATADMLANVLRVTDPTQVQAHKEWEKEALALLKAGNAARLGLKDEGAITGQNHGQFPKLPSSEMPPQ